MTVADTARRTLRLLSLLATRRRWPLSELVARLDVSERTIRRDIETLRLLDYPITTVHGPAGGYQLGSGHVLPPQIFDDGQALAVAVALQTAPSTVFGLEEDADRALETLKQIMPARLRAAMESLQLTTLQNYWEFAAPPINTEALTVAGSAVRNHHVLIAETLGADGTRAAPSDERALGNATFRETHQTDIFMRWPAKPQISRTVNGMGCETYRLCRRYGG